MELTVLKKVQGRYRRGKNLEAGKNLLSYLRLIGRKVKHYMLVPVEDKVHCPVTKATFTVKDDERFFQKGKGGSLIH
jgi:hypothetical protein